MDSKNKNPHYHIHWSRAAPLNWKCFNTRAEAEALAKLFAAPGEIYAIEEHGEVCQPCMDAAKGKLRDLSCFSRRLPPRPTKLKNSVTPDVRDAANGEREIGS